MEFSEINKNYWEAFIVYDMTFYGYGSTKQEAGSNCLTEMQNYIDKMQEALNENIK